jgi:hypothetical protein
MAIKNWGSLTRPYRTDAAPADGAVGTGTFAGHAPVGAELIDDVTGYHYRNTGTQAVPVWSRVLAANSAALTGAAVAVLAAEAVLGGLGVLFHVHVLDAASDSTSITVTNKIRVIDVWAVKRGGGGHATEDTIQVLNGTNAITDAVALGNADKAIVRAATIDDAYYEIAAAGTLKVTWVKGASGGNDSEADVYILAAPVA